MTMKLTYNVEDIFQEIPDDADNITMTIPPELIEAAGWKEGDELVIKIEEGAVTITKHV